MSDSAPLHPAADRNLLFGVLALQADLIDSERFAQACTLWSAKKTTLLADLLVQQGWLTPEDRDDVERLLERKLRKHGGDARTGLAEVTTDHVRQTLASLNDADIRQSLAGLTPPPQGHVLLSTTDHIPETRDRYTLSRLHATGGIGRVWLAHDASLGRDVALKELRPERAGSPAIWARFLREAQVTGQLEHPGIVPVYEVGRQPDDRAPFYTMRFVRGRTLAQAARAYHDRRSRGDAELLELRELLTAFIGVCNAVAYAHSRGVLHRDLKPQNVVLGDYGEVVVLDWGLARLMDEPEGDAAPINLSDVGTAGATVQGQVLGTPAYLSPEQAEGRQDLLGPCTDVYGLGAVLYEILVGSPPFSGPDTTEVLRRVLHQEPDRPRSLVPATPLALEAVCLKALAKKPGDRYSTAKELAGEVQRWLADEPVRAYPEPLWARARRWIGRHRTLATSAAASMAVAILALTCGLALLTKANAREQRERERAEQAEQIAKREEADERAAEQKATESAAESRAVLDFFQRRVLAAARPKGREGGLHREVTLRQALEAALPFVERSFKDQPIIEARLRSTLGVSFQYLGDARIAAEQHQAARTLYAQYRGPDHPATLDSMNQLASCYGDLGRNADALKLQEETLSLRKAKLGPDHPETLGTMNDLANSYANLGRYEDALRITEETLAVRKSKLGPDHSDTLDTMNNLANCYDVLGRDTDALKLREETLAIRKAKLVPGHPDTLGSMSNLANSYAAVGRHADALKLREETLALTKANLGPVHRNTLISMNNLAESYAAVGRHVDAFKLHEETLALRKANLGPDHPDTLASMNSVAESHSALGRHADALKVFEQTLALKKAKLGLDHPETLKCMGNLAECLLKLGRAGEALPVIDECIRRATGKDLHRLLMPYVMDIRLRHFEKNKNGAECRQTAVLWEQLKRTDADSLYNAATLRAVTAAVLKQAPGADAAKPSGEEADRAMSWLKQAVVAGYKDVAQMEKDNDLDALRGREDFKKLLAELKAAPVVKK